MHCFSPPILRQLTNDGQRKLGPAFINPVEIAFAVHESPNLVAIRRLRLDDGSQQRFHPNQSGHQFDPCFSGDGRYHAYALSSTSPQLVLVIQDRRDGRDRVFHPRDARATARNPTIAPDGSRVAFSLSDVNGHQIASVDMKGADLKLLTISAGLNTAPAFSPDGRRLAFSSSRGGDFEIYTMNVDGDDVRRLTESPGRDTRPSWSPDGRRIAFTSNRDGCSKTYLMNADGSNCRRLMVQPLRQNFVAWHPSGDSLLIVGELGGKCDLYLVQAPS